MNRNLFLAKSLEDLERCYSVMRELRPHLTLDAFLSIYNEAQKADGYEIVGIEVDGKVLAVMGYRFLHDFVRGKHLYIDDLVSTASSRSAGLGSELLKYAEKMALENGCSNLRLCTGIENARGVSFYEKNGWSKRAFAYTKKLHSLKSCQLL